LIFFLRSKSKAFLLAQKVAQPPKGKALSIQTIREKEEIVKITKFIRRISNALQKAFTKAFK